MCSWIVVTVQSRKRHGSFGLAANREGPNCNIYFGLDDIGALMGLEDRLLLCFGVRGGIDGEYVACLAGGIF